MIWKAWNLSREEPDRMLTVNSIPNRNSYFFFSRLLAAGLFLLLAAGCSTPQMIDLDYHFSMNVAKPPAGFPDKKLKLTAAESEVVARRGKPDFIRIWWRPDGSLIRSSDLAGKGDTVGVILGAAKKSWIYMTDEKEAEEVLFVGPGYKVRPLDEKIKLVCTYGDPSTRTPPIMRDGHMCETWLWIEHGLQLELQDGKEFSRSNFDAAGSGTYLGK